MRLTHVRMPKCTRMLLLRVINLPFYLGTIIWIYFYTYTLINKNMYARTHTHIQIRYKLIRNRFAFVNLVCEYAYDSPKTGRRTRVNLTRSTRGRYSDKNYGFSLHRSENLSQFFQFAVVPVRHTRPSLIVKCACVVPREVINFGVRQLTGWHHHHPLMSLSLHDVTPSLIVVTSALCDLRDVPFCSRSHVFLANSGVLNTFRD